MVCLERFDQFIGRNCLLVSASCAKPQLTRMNAKIVSKTDHIVLDARRTEIYLSKQRRSYFLRFLDYARRHDDESVNTQNLI